MELCLLRCALFFNSDGQGSRLDGMRALELEDGLQRRFEKAQSILKDAAGGFHSSALVNVGDTIQVDHEAGFLR